MSSRTARMTIFTIVLAIGAAGCGGHATKKTSNGSLPLAEVSASHNEATPTTVAAKAGAKQAKSPAKAATPQAGSQTTTTWDQSHHVVTMPSWFTITLDKDCIHAKETQGLTV